MRGRLLFAGSGRARNLYTFSLGGRRSEVPIIGRPVAAVGRSDARPARAASRCHLFIGLCLLLARVRAPNYEPQMCVCLRACQSAGCCRILFRESALASRRQLGSASVSTSALEMRPIEFKSVDRSRVAAQAKTTQWLPNANIYWPYLLAVAASPVQFRSVQFGRVEANQSWSSKWTD